MHRGLAEDDDRHAGEEPARHEDPAIVRVFRPNGRPRSGSRLWPISLSDDHEYCLDCREQGRSVHDGHGHPAVLCRPATWAFFDQVAPEPADVG